MPEQPAFGSHGNMGAGQPVARRGSAILLGSSFLFCGSDIFIKLITAWMPLGQFMLLRGGFCILLFLVLLRGSLRLVFRAMAHPQVILRSFLEAVSVGCFVLALQSLPLAIVTATYMTGPLLTILLAGILGLSRITFQLVLAAAMSFCGVLLVAIPGREEISPAILLAFAAAATVAARDLITRRMPQHIPSSAVALNTMIAVALSGIVLSPFDQGWDMPSATIIALTFIAACFTVAGNYLVIVAFRIGDPALMAVLRYASIPLALIIGGLVFRYIPGPGQILGAAMVITGGTLGLLQARLR